jgi:hypothetical protein
VYPANDAGPAITTVPILSVDASVQFNSSEKSGSAPVLGDQRPRLAIYLLLTLLH